MRLAGIGRAQHGGNAGTGRPFIAERGVRGREGHICRCIYVLARLSSLRGAWRRSNPYFRCGMDGFAEAFRSGGVTRATGRPAITAGQELIDSLAPFALDLFHFATAGTGSCPTF
jgi:hypothetical protein